MSWGVKTTPFWDPKGVKKEDLVSQLEIIQQKIHVQDYIPKSNAQFFGGKSTQP